MTWTALRHLVREWGWMFATALSWACTGEPAEQETGHTTTTYGATNGNSSGTSSADDDDEESADSTEPDPSDDGPDPSDDGPDPSDDGPDPSDTDEPPPPCCDLPVLDLPPDTEGLPNGATCSSDEECDSHNCYVVPFLGGQCGECNEDADCDGGGCSPPNPFENFGSLCNMGEPGGGCESDAVCADGLTCSNVFDLLGLIQINTCGWCESDLDCGDPMMICAPLVDVGEFVGLRDCIYPSTLPQDSYCALEENGDDVCESGICSTIDIMGLAEVGACGECNTDADCGNGGTCVAGEFILDTGTLLGSTCQ